MLTFQDEQLRQQLKTETGHDASHLYFGAFPNLEENLRAQLGIIRANAFLPRGIELFGFIYDVRTGRLLEIREAAGARAATLSSR